MGRYEVRIAGFGGQGVITSGYVLANAASIHDGKYSVMTPSYGPEARGGACKSDVVVSEAPIDFPKVTEPDCLVAMSLDAYQTFGKDVKEGGVIIYDEDLVPLSGSEAAVGVSYVGIPGARVAGKLGNSLVANMVMLGALVGLTGIVSLESVRGSVRERFSRFVDLNLNALERGVELAKTHSPKIL